MRRTSDFVRPSDVTDPDRTMRAGEIDYSGTEGRKGSTAVVLICIVGVIGLAALLPQTRYVLGAGPGHAISVVTG
ncbi:MAG: hypothetical protein ACREF3_21230 [Acetobacteraceae bacterium]